ncbi:MAG: MFS transporter [Acidimicrobiales bacterium]|nr:MFS transporter [Acidimicrobiales bacterium]RZV45224.1 MAG: MFS transporter [Acidimicrobiales bacterium]
MKEDVLAPPSEPDRSFLGDVDARPLLPVQGFHSIGEGLFALSLADSLFFNVSVDAARPRILLYLALTMAPFVLLAPFIGPLIDRHKGGHRAVLALSIGGRSLVAVMLATQLKTLLLYPQAFAIVVLSKVYLVSRNALVPSLVDDRDHLVVVNSRLARVGAISGVVGGIIGVAVLQIADSSWVLRTGALFYAFGAIAALRLPPPHTDDLSASPIVEDTEMHGPGVTTASIGMAGVRMATGFILFHVGFELKTSGLPTWVIALVVGSIALGGFTGTFVAPRIRRRFDQQEMITGSLMLLAVFASLTALRFHAVTALALAAAVGLAGSVARRGFDGVVQTEAPHARRGRAFAGLETRLEISWVIGSLIAVLARAPDWLGLIILAVGLVALSGNRFFEHHRAEKVLAEVGADTLALRLLETAEAVAAQGDRQQAVLVALAAADAACMDHGVCTKQVSALRERGLDATNRNDPELEAEVIREAHALVTESAN